MTERDVILEERSQGCGFQASGRHRDGADARDAISQSSLRRADHRLAVTEIWRAYPWRTRSISTISTIRPTNAILIVAGDVDPEGGSRNLRASIMAPFPAGSLSCPREVQVRGASAARRDARPDSTRIRDVAHPYLVRSYLPRPSGIPGPPEQGRKPGRSDTNPRGSFLGGSTLHLRAGHGAAVRREHRGSPIPVRAMAPYRSMTVFLPSRLPRRTGWTSPPPKSRGMGRAVIRGISGDRPPIRTRWSESRTQLRAPRKSTPGTTCKVSPAATVSR